MDVEAVGISDTHYSSSMDFRRCAGNAALFIISSAGLITVSQQCSWDNKIWHDPVDLVGSSLGVVRALLSVTSGIYVPFTPVMSAYIRFKVVEGGTAGTSVTLRIIYRVET